MILYDNKMKQLNELVLKENTHVLSGRDFGNNMRYLLNLDYLDKTSRSYFIQIPDSIYCMTANFFIGMFYNSIKNLGEIDFRNKYKFLYKDDSINLNIEDGIQDCLLFLHTDFIDDGGNKNTMKTNTSLNYMQLGAQQRLAMSYMQKNTSSICCRVSL